MPRCQFTIKYFDYEIRKWDDFYCQGLPLVSGFCIVHHNDRCLRDKTDHEKRQKSVLDRLKRKVNHAISNKEPLLCIGFQLQDFRFSDLSIDKKFTKSVYFSNSQFYGKTDFYAANFKGEIVFSSALFERRAYFYAANFQGEAFFQDADFQGIAYFKAKFKQADFFEAHFQGEADFSMANFKEETYFNQSEFYGKTYFSNRFNGKTEFHHVLFKRKEKVIFDVENLSNVSFINTDITGVRFSDKARWGGKKVEYDKFWGGKNVKEDRFKIVDERLLEKEIKEKGGRTTKDLNLGSIKAAYRSLRENYEYRMRYDEAGQFFIREMKLKRKYRKVLSEEEENSSLEIKQNNWFRRNLFSLTGWYYHLSRYGESLWRPTLAGLAIVILSTLFWSTQENPELKPWLPIFQDDDDTGNVTKFVGFDKFGDGDHWLKAYERSIAGFIPLLSLGSNIHVGIIDYVIKIVGGAVVFALIAVALRRRFERK